LFQRILRQFKDCIREKNYVVTLHAEEEMDEDELSIFDMERAILTGNIIERQKDREIKGWKYLIRGQIIDGSKIVVVGKLSPTGKMVIITVFRE
jgi:hypothetical protein